MQEGALVHPGEVEHDGRGLHVLDLRLQRGCAGPIGDIRVACRVDHASGADRLATGFGLGDDPADLVALHDGSHELAVQHRVNAGLFHQPVGDELEAFGIEFVAQRLALWNRGSRALGPVLELAPDPAGLDRSFMTVPGEPFDADGRDVAAETAEALDQRDLDASARRRQRRRQAARARAHDEHVGFMDHIDVALRFADRFHHGGVSRDGAKGRNSGIYDRFAASMSSFRRAWLRSVLGPMTAVVRHYGTAGVRSRPV